MFDPFAHIDQICRLYTDAGITPDWKKRIEQAGITITICGSDR
jgi:hypothetical protein